jgi:hypothetical protein
MRRNNRVVASILLVTTISGCATSGRSTLLGAGAGAGLGAGIGAMVDPGPKGEGRIRNVFIGATAGSLIGVGTGYLAHEELGDRDKAAYEKGKREAEKSNAVPAGGGAPVLLPARVESRFVDEQVRGSIYVPAHFEYVIVEPARWSK